MSITFNRPTSTVAGRVTRTAAEVAISLMDGIRRMIIARRNRRILSDLPDHILRDIGISRGEIDSIAWTGNSDTSRRQRGDRGGRLYL